MKRFLSALLIFTLCLSLMSSCGKDAESTAAEEMGEKETVRDVKSINYTFPDNLGNDPNNLEYYMSNNAIFNENEMYVSYDITIKGEEWGQSTTEHFLYKADRSGNELAKLKLDYNVSLMNWYDGKLYGEYNRDIVEIDPLTLEPKIVVDNEEPSYDENRKIYIEDMLIVGDFLFYIITSGGLRSTSSLQDHVYAINLKTLEKIDMGGLKTRDYYHPDPILTSDGETLYLITFVGSTKVRSFPISDITSNTTVGTDFEELDGVSDKQIAIGTNGIFGYFESDRNNEIDGYYEAYFDGEDGSPESIRVSTEMNSFTGQVYDINGVFYSVNTSSGFTLFSYTDRNPTTRTQVCSYADIISFCKYDNHLYAVQLVDETPTIIQLV